MHNIHSYTCQVKNLNYRYRDGLPLTLKGLNFEVNGGERIGVVGRTGAGKSTLMLAMFRLNEAVSGSISIDDVDVSKISLRTLRSSLAIIPQDPVLCKKILSLLCPIVFSPFERRLTYHFFFSISCTFR